jgi:hypothetical protein
MPTIVITRDVSGTTQTAASAGATSTSVVLSDWNNTSDWVVVVEMTMMGRGIITGAINSYYRRETYKWTATVAAPLTVGSLLSNITDIEETIAWDGIVERSGNNIQIKVTGGSTEKVSWTWYGTIIFQKVN